MPYDDLLNAMAADSPRLRRLVAEYGEEGHKAIERFMRDEPAEAAALVAAMVGEMKARPADC